MTALEQLQAAFKNLLLAINVEVPKPSEDFQTYIDDAKTALEPLSAFIAGRQSRELLMKALLNFDEAVEDHGSSMVADKYYKGSDIKEFIETTFRQFESQPIERESKDFYCGRNEGHGYTRCSVQCAYCIAVPVPLDLHRENDELRAKIISLEAIQYGIEEGSQQWQSKCAELEQKIESREQEVEKAVIEILQGDYVHTVKSNADIVKCVREYFNRQPIESRESKEEDAADEKLTKELENDPEMTEIMNDLNESQPPVEAGREKEKLLPEYQEGEEGTVTVSKLIWEALNANVEKYRDALYKPVMSQQEWEKSKNPSSPEKEFNPDKPEEYYYNNKQAAKRADAGDKRRQEHSDTSNE